MALIKCKECEKNISDQAKVCPHCGAPTEISKEIRRISNKILYCIIISIVTLFVIIICANGIRCNRKSYIYGKQAIDILNSLKEDKISQSVAYDRLEKIRENVREEYSKLDSNSSEYNRLFLIGSHILGVQIDITGGKITILEINNSIKEINKELLFFS